ncbi:MAG: helix-turn-helix domain-containing protein [Alphaproteobacteria bacterium]
MPAEPTGRRSGCPISFALDVLGDRWTLLVLRDVLIKGRSRFGELRAAEEGIASNILADRLKRLVRAGILVRRPDPQDRRRVVYGATPKGAGLIPVLLELAAWGATHDAGTAAPAGFVAAFRADRDAMIARLVDAVRR